MNLEVFNNNEFGEIRVLAEGGRQLLSATDCARALGYTNPHKAVQDHCKNVVLRWTNDSLGRVQETNFIPEGDLYRLIVRSRLPSAERFESWVFDEVLPTIRTTGAYNPNVPKTLPDALRAYAVALEEKQALEQQIQLDKPRVLFSQAVEASDTSILVGDLAKILKQNGIDVGQNRLFDWMRDNGYLIKSGSSRNMPTQYSMDREWFEIQERVVHVPDREPKITRTPKVTGKGQMYFVNRFISDYEKAQ